MSVNYSVYRKIAENEWMYKIRNDGHNLLKVVGEIYLECLFSCEDDLQLVFEKMVKKIESTFSTEIKCGIEPIKLLKVLRAIGGKGNVPNGYEWMYEKYKSDPNLYRLGKTINTLERGKEFRCDDLIIV